MHPNPSKQRMFLRAIAVAIAILFSAGVAQARGSWEWGPSGFSAGWTAQQREAYIVDYGIADPAANYWTPFWSGSAQSNNYTGVPDTSFRNTFAVNHDINVRHGIPLLGYLDIFTPLFGTNQLEIASTVSAIWDGIVEMVTSVWDSITSLFESDYSSYESTGSYSDYGGYDNAFDSGYGGYGYGGGY